METNPESVDEIWSELKDKVTVEYPLENFDFDRSQTGSEADLRFKRPLFGVRWLGTAFRLVPFNEEKRCQATALQREGKVVVGRDLDVYQATTLVRVESINTSWPL